MSTAEVKKPRYRIPSVSVDADVSIDEFSTKAIIGYLRHKGYRVDGEGDEGASGGGNEVGSDEAVISKSELNRISTLSFCGQRDQARDLAMQIIGEAIGRVL